EVRSSRPLCGRAEEPSDDDRLSWASRVVVRGFVPLASSVRARSSRLLYAKGGGLRGCSYRSSSGVKCLEVGDEGVVDLAGQVALDAAHDLRFGQAFLGPPFDIGAGAGTEPHPDHHGQVQGPVGVAVAAAVQPVPAGLARAGDSAQV